MNKEAKQRKETPVYTGFISYFPDTIKEVAKVSYIGNEQHNKGEPLHWAREKSTDQMDAAMRHIVDHASGEVFDTDGTYHLAKAIWRLCAELQIELEKTWGAIDINAPIDELLTAVEEELSPTFDNAEDAIKWLKGKTKD